MPSTSIHPSLLTAPGRSLRAPIKGLACLLLVGGVVLSGCSSEDLDEQEWGQEWNVLLVTLDTVRADRLGCYGDQAASTPHLDGLAQEGVRFECAISTAGLTPMAHASILTGRNPYSHGLRVFYGDLEHRLSPDIASLPSMLAARGWRTAAFVSAYPVSEIYGLDNGYQRFRTGVRDSIAELDISHPQKHRGYWQDSKLTHTQRRGDHTTDEALTWLEQFGDAGPWHMWLHYFDVHDFSLVPPVEFAERAGVVYDKTLGPKDVSARELMYDLELSFVDAQIGRVLEHLESSGQLEQTLIVVVADHGQGLGDGLQRHSWLLHRLVYEWSIRVPLILRLPGEQGGVVVPELVRTIDILPTVLEALDLDPPGGLEGRSVLPILRGELDEPRIAYADALNLEDAHSPGSRLPENQRDNLFVAMDQRWKLIHHATLPANSELYDLEADPLELVNVHAQHPEVVQRLRRFLEMKDAFRLVPSSAETAVPDSSSLEALGYTGEASD
jgi:arylsulfatase A-like enzyme